MVVKVNVHDAKSQLSKLLELVEGGETVIIARNGLPVVELIPASERIGLPLDIARDNPLVPPGDDWWARLEDHEGGEEIAVWTDGA